jgi:propanol-preferring alcohol dehydrogenase
MKAMVIPEIADMKKNREPLQMVELPVPGPKEGEILIKVTACGVCHTELDEIEGRTPPTSFPMVPGHQVVGTVVEKGKKASRFQEGDRVGVAWIFSACGHCHLCAAGEENICPDFRATGRDAPGGYAEFMTVSEEFAYSIPDVFTDLQAAPLLCAGAIGYRSFRLCDFQPGENLGLTGFGGSAHLVIKMVLFLYPDTRVFVFARNPREREFARELGACWAGDTADLPPKPVHRIIDTTPVYKPVVEALARLAPGGRLVINAIRKEEVDKNYLLNLDYEKHLWMEKEIKSVANVARKDVSEFLELAARMKLEPEVQAFSLEEANRALQELRESRIRGAKVLDLRKRSG